METSLRRCIAALHLLAIVLIVSVFGWAGLSLVLINPHGMSGILGVSYPEPNSSTAADLVAMTAEAREQLWVKSVVFGVDEQYQECPFADGMMGGKFARKAIINIKDTEKVNGNTVNIPLLGGFGGPGVQGEGTRLGQEQQIKIGNMTVQIGRQWYGYSWTSVARDETVIGGPLDKIIREASRQQFAKKRNDDIMMTMISTAGLTGRNYMLPPGVANRAALTTANVFATQIISNAGLSLSGLGGKPMDLSKDASGSTKKRYVMLGTDQGFVPLESEDAFLNAYLNADVRGSGNGVWTGNYKDWMGHELYRWNQIDTGNWGPVGSPLLPRALLGVAVTSAASATVIQGGGSNAAAAATPAPLYFNYFTNSPYTYHNGNTIAAGSAQAYLRITNPDGSYGICNYTANNGNQITLNGTTTLSPNVGTQTLNFVVGALIQECNVLGVPFCRTLALASEAVATGLGAIDGTPANLIYGKRSVEILNYGMNIGVGCEQSWGCAPIMRWDGVYPGFILIETALPLPTI